MLSAETQITNLLFTYAERIDAGDIDRLADLFAHAVLSGGGGEAQGREGALTWFGGGGDGQRRKTKHVTTNVIIELDDAGTRAEVRSVYHVLLEADDGKGCTIMTAGRYHDEIELVDGSWRFARREYIQDLAPLGI
jgi:3-phenylpropionate/cinnamic acid dioxygenase small subunit